MVASLDKKLYLIIPAYNEADHGYLEKTILDAQSRDEIAKIIVVSDGSTDGTDKKVFGLKSSCSKLEPLIFYKNKGKEGVVKDALKFLSGFIDCKDPYTCVGLMDADGQHKVEDIIRMYHEAIDKNVDFVGGYRNFNRQNIPFERKFANRCTEFFVRILGGIPSKDHLFGQKVFHSTYVKMLAGKLNENGRYGIEPSLTSKILWEGASYAETPVEAEYENCSKKSGMGIKNTRWLKQFAYTLKIAAQNRFKKT